MGARRCCPRTFESAKRVLRMCRFSCSWSNRTRSHRKRRAHVQMTYRNLATIFLPCEVFNTSVDKRVENGGFSRANYIFLSSLNHFAPFGCKKSRCKNLETSKNHRRDTAENIFSSRRRFSHLRAATSKRLGDISNFRISQYHFGGRSRRILIVCFTSVTSY